MDQLNLVSSLHALPETAPVEIEGIQFGGGNNTCQSACLSILGVVTTVNLAQTICQINSTC